MLMLSCLAGTMLKFEFDMVVLPEIFIGFFLLLLVYSYVCF